MIRWLRYVMCAAWVSMGGMGLLYGCHSITEARTGSETNWLKPCASGACAYGSCLCSVCSVACTADADCSGTPGPSRCVSTTGSEFASICTESSPPAGICLPACDSATSCPSGQDCVNGGCVVTQATTPTSDAASPTGDASDAVLTLSGTVAGAPFVAKDAIVAQTLTWKSSIYPGTSTVILISDWPNLCSGIQSAITPVNSHLVIFDLADVVAGTAQPISNTGDYTFVTDYLDLTHPSEFTAYYDHVNAQCGFGKGSATAGTLTLSDANPNSPKGTLSLTFDDGGSLSGDFGINQSCPTAAVDTYLNRNPTCN